MSPHPFEIRLMAIEALRPAPYNPRAELEPDSPAYRKLAASLHEFGLVEPLVWNEATGHIVGGHARLRILKQMHVTQVAVSVVRLTDEREKALNIVLNNREAQGRFDPAKLADLLSKLVDLPEMKLTGFDSSTLTTLRLTPARDDVPASVNAGTVEITLTMDADTYERCSPRLDDLIGAFDLHSHVRRR